MTQLQTLLDHRSRFLAFLRTRMPDAAQAEDVLQSAYLSALKHQNEWRSQESIVGWFYRVLRNAVIDRHRRTTTEEKALTEWARDVDTDMVMPVELKDAVCGCLAAAVDTLSPGYAEILRQVDLAEEPLSHFARRHGITQNNATVRMHRARAALRKQLIACCGACAEHHCLDCTCRL